MGAEQDLPEPTEAELRKAYYAELLREKKEKPSSSAAWMTLLVGVLGTLVGSGGALAFMKFSAGEKEQTELVAVNARLDTIERIANSLGCLSTGAPLTPIQTVQREALVAELARLTGHSIDCMAPYVPPVPGPHGEAAPEIPKESSIPPAALPGGGAGAGGPCGGDEKATDK